MKLEVGKKYTSKNNHEFECIVVTDTHTWLKGGDDQTAYVWTIDGKSVSLGEDYDLKPQPREFLVYLDERNDMTACFPEGDDGKVNRGETILVREVMPE
jgi:hypothetical protein